MSLASLPIDTFWGRQPLARLIHVERALGRGTFRFDPVAKRAHNNAIRGFIQQARASA